MNNRLIETRQDRRALVADAGIGGISFLSVIAGVLVAYGAFAIGLAIAAGVTAAVGVDTDLSSNWERLGTVGGLIVAGILFLSYLFGGYVAGRMARRRGVVHGLAVAVLGVALVAVVAFLVRQAADAQSLAANLRDLGLPTTADEYGNALTLAGVASFVALLLGSLCGGILGERWHGRLLSRAVDPDIGPEADARRTSAEEMSRSEEARTRSFQRARNADPARTNRADREAVSAGGPVSERESDGYDSDGSDRASGRYDSDVSDRDHAVVDDNPAPQSRRVRARSNGSRSRSSR